MSNVRRETDLYEPMAVWLKTYMEDMYSHSRASVLVTDAHAWTLDRVLEQHNVIQYFPQVVGLDIEIDVLGIAKHKSSADLFFIEAKKTALSIRDLGQLWVYCRLCDPKGAFLLSSHSLGGLNKLLNTLHREDLLDYGEKKEIRKIKVGLWDVDRGSVNYSSLVPKI